MQKIGNVVEVVEKEQFIEEFEEKHDVTVKVLGSKGSRICAFVHRKSLSSFAGKKNHVIIELGDRFYAEAPVDILEAMIWNAMGKCKDTWWERTGQSVDIYALENSGLDADKYFLALKKAEMYYIYGSFDLDLMKYLGKLSRVDKLRICFGRIDLPTCLRKKGLLS